MVWSSAAQPDALEIHSETSEQDNEEDVSTSLSEDEESDLSSPPSSPSSSLITTTAYGTELDDEGERESDKRAMISFNDPASGDMGTVSDVGTDPEAYSAAMSLLSMSRAGFVPTN